MDHALLHFGYAIAAVAAHAQISVSQYGVVRIKTETAVQRAHQSARGNHRRSDQQGADGDLHDKREVSNGDVTPDAGERSRFDDFIGIGVKYMPYRDGAKEESAGQSQEQSHAINVGVRVHRHMDGPSGKWLPCAQSAEERNAAPEPDSAAHQGKQHGFRKELPQNARAAGSKSKAQGHFARTVSGPRGEEAAEVGASGQQNQAGEEHQSGHESADGLAKIVAIETWTSQGKRSFVVVLGIGFFEIGADGVQIGNRLCRSDSRFQMSHGHKNPAVAARVQVIYALDLLLVHDGHKETRIEKHQGAVEAGRRYTDDGKGLLVDLDNAAYHAAIIL